MMDSLAVWGCCGFFCFKISMIFLWEIAEGVSVILFYLSFLFFLPALGLHGSPWASVVVALALGALGNVGS